MNNDTNSLWISADDFARRFSLRARNLMWLLGAGASAAAGVPTAWDMIWEFKQLLFVSQRNASPTSVADLSNPVIRAQLQAHIDSADHLPPSGSPDEYAALFEEVYPSEMDRRLYLDAKVAGAKPSYGHFALSTLMRADLAPLVWTTNFDPLIADACAKIYEATGHLTTVTLDAPELAEQLVSEGRWPVEVKLHGDFHSRRLKNTTDELRHQDAHLRQVLADTSRRFGVVVVGYSGRDDSVMDALEQPLALPGAFPSGIFWLHRGEAPPLSRVEQFLIRAADAGVEVAMVQVDNFDEAMRDLLRLFTDIDTKALDSFAEGRRRWSGAPSPSGRRGWPVVRLNALPITQMPSVCRRVVCDIGGYSDVRQAVEQSGVGILFARTRAGVLAFGSDEDVRLAFENHEIADFDLHTIETNRLWYDSGERGLLRDALTRAIARERNIEFIRRRSADLLMPVEPSDEAWKPLQKLVGRLFGTVRDNPELRWYEGVSARLDWADDQLWLLIDPCTVFDGIKDENRASAADFARERTVKRYNRELNDLIAFWSNFLGGDGTDLRALGISDGVDATFRISSDTGFSRRAQA